MSTTTSSVFEEPNTMFEGSTKSIRSELDLTSIPGTDVSTLFYGDYSQYYPQISTRENYNPLEFRITPDSAGYLDLADSFLLIKCRIVLQDGKPCDENDIVSPGVLFLHSMFSNIELYVNNKLVKDSSNFYPYEAYIRKHLSTSPEEKQNGLLNEFYYPNNVPDNFSNDPSSGDQGFMKRFSMTQNSKSFTMLGRLDVNLFLQNRYLPSETLLTISLRRSPPQFCLNAPKETKNGFTGCPYTYQIIQAVLFIRRKIISPAIINEHRKDLASGKTLKYPMMDTEITTYSIGKGITSNIQENVLMGRIPKILVIGFVSSSALDGALTKSPFNFQNFNLSEINVSTNIQSMQYNTIPLDFSENDFLVALQTLQKTASDPTLGNGITRDNFTLGNNLLAFEIFPIVGNTLSMNKMGSIRISVKFKEPLPENINVIVYSQYQTLLEIDGNRNVHIEQ